MALNMDDKKLLAQEILPEVDFVISATGLTVISSERLETPRFLPFENGGKCKECKSNDIEVDFCVEKGGVHVYCNRFKGARFVPFDRIHDLPCHCFFKVCIREIFNVFKFTLLPFWKFLQKFR
jgi:hypothetical protein